MAHNGLEEVVEQPRAVVKELFELLEFLAAQRELFFGRHDSRLSTVTQVKFYEQRAVLAPLKVGGPVFRMTSR